MLFHRSYKHLEMIAFNLLSRNSEAGTNRAFYTLSNARTGYKMFHLYESSYKIPFKICSGDQVCLMKVHKCVSLKSSLGNSVSNDSVDLSVLNVSISWTILHCSLVTEKNHCSQIHFSHLGFPFFRSYQNKGNQTNCEPQTLII